MVDLLAPRPGQTSRPSSQFTMADVTTSVNQISLSCNGLSDVANQEFPSPALAPLGRPLPQGEAMARSLARDELAPRLSPLPAGGCQSISSPRGRGLR